MDASTAVVTLHGLDPGFREICDALYPGLDPREVADAVYGSGVSKAEPDSADVHVPTTVWRNGRGHTKGRGRRKIDNTVLSTRFVKNGEVGKLFGIGKPKQAGQSSNTGGLARGIGLGTTAVGTGISAVSLPKHLREIPSAMKAAKTGPNVSAGLKSAVKTVRGLAKPAQAALPGIEEGGSAIKTGLGAAKAGLGVARANPRISAGLLLGATALHTANLGGEAIATHVLHNQAPPKPKKIKVPAVQGMGKAWDQAQALIIDAHRQGLISKSEALALGKAVANDLAKAMSNTAMLAPTKLVPLKAPTPVTADQPKQRFFAKPATSGAGRKAGGSTQKKNASPKNVKKSGEDVPDAVAEHDPVGRGRPDRELEIEGEISKLDEDKMQTFGWASVVKIDGKKVVDKQNDFIEIDDIEDAAYDYVQHSRKGGDMHKRADDGSVHQAAEMIESMVFTPEKIAKMDLPKDMPLGWWIGMQVHDADLWADVKSGKKTKFSIHGSGVRQEVLVDD